MNPDILAKLTSANSLFGMLAVSATGTALTIGDRTTQVIAGILAVVFALCYVYTTPSRSEVVLTKDIEDLDPNKPIKPVDILGEAANPNVLKPDPKDTSTNLGLPFRKP